MHHRETPRSTRRPWAKSSIHKGWRTFRHRIDLDDVTVHDLRRTCASYLSIYGENLPTIQNVLNHRSLGPTAIYAPLNVQAVDRALQKQADRFIALQETPDYAVLALEGNGREGVPVTAIEAGYC